MQKTTTYCNCILITICFFSCKESFEPNLPVVPQGYLVVEGVINANGPTQIKLSRTTQLDQVKIFRPELDAIVNVEDEANSSIKLNGISNGMYFSPSVSLNSNRKYRLRIKTKNNKEYVSDFVPVKITPPIDSISWKQENGGVQIYVNTHDRLNKTTYYHWSYDETWEIHSKYYALARFENGEPRPARQTDPQIYTCWKYDTSSRILLGSSARLQNDIISMSPIHFVSRHEERLGVRYSIQITQYALEKGAYLFMEQMKKNTELLGTIFDPQPSALKGNLHSVSDLDEAVIGYVSATTIERKRIFISYAELSGSGFFLPDCTFIFAGNGNFCCTNDTVPVKEVKEHYPRELPYYPIDGPMGGIIAYLVSTSSCVDCTLRGSNIKPSFW